MTGNMLKGGPMKNQAATVAPARVETEPAQGIAGHVDTVVAQRKAAARAGLEEAKAPLRGDYERCRGALQDINRELPAYQSFVATHDAQLGRLENCPLDIRLGLEEMGRICAVIVGQLEGAIQAYELLSYKQLAAEGIPGATIRKIRLQLKSHDGILSRLRQLRGQVETLAKEWLAAAGGVGQGVSVPPVSDRGSSPKVHSNFDPGN